MKAHVLEGSEHITVEDDAHKLAVHYYNVYADSDWTVEEIEEAIREYQKNLYNEINDHS
jgi:hypothetical protein